MLGQGSIKNLNFSFLGQIFQYICWVSKHVDWGSQHIPIFLLGLKACLLRFALFGIRAQILKSVFYPFYLLFPVIIKKKKKVKKENVKMKSEKKEKKRW